MKQGTYINRLVMLLLFLALAAYLGVYTYQSLRDPFTSTLCYSYTVDDKVEATGWVVRQEVPLPRQEGLVDILPDEGEKVAAGETVAVIYRDAEALDRKGQIRQLELELEQLEYSLRQDSNGSDAARLDQDILAAMVELRGSTAAEDYSRLEENAMELKNLVFRRNYTYSNNTESVESIKAMIKAVSAELSALKSVSSQESTGLRSTIPGIYSGQVDGLELVLTPESILEMRPSDLDALKSGGDSEAEGQTGRIITSSRWYFAVSLAEADAKRLAEGDRVTLRFSRDFTGDVTMEVAQLSEPENGRVAAVLTANRRLSDITLLRRQTVEIIFDTTDGIRVPKAALRLQEETQTDENGAQTQVQQPGIYAVVGAQAEWKPVTILAEGEDFFLVKPAPFKNDQDTKETKKALRSGDEIIVNAENLYDGKVVK